MSQQGPSTTTQVVEGIGEFILMIPVVYIGGAVGYGLLRWIWFLIFRN